MGRGINSDVILDKSPLLSHRRCWAGNKSHQDELECGPLRISLRWGRALGAELMAEPSPSHTARLPHTPSNPAVANEDKPPSYKRFKGLN